MSVTPDLSPPTGPPGWPAIYGHRGSVRPGPANTEAAIRAAMAAGADGAETDLRRRPAPRRGLVLSHDPVIGGAATLSAGLDAVVGRGRLICEIKNVPGQPDFDPGHDATARLLLDTLEHRAARGVHDDVVVSSFDPLVLAAVRGLGGPPTALLLPVGASLRAGATRAGRAGHAEVHAHWTSVTRVALAGLDRHVGSGPRLVVWTVGSVTRARRLARLGVAGLICDDPAAVVAARSTWPPPRSD